MALTIARAHFFFPLSLSLRSYDVDPVKRKETPDFYGYIPDGLSRTLIFGCMVVNGALLLLSRSFCAAMLMLVGKRYFVGYSALDMGLYLLQKVLREDFTYWMPVEGGLGYLVSVIMRVIFKIVTDYTGIVQFRGAAEMGGIYWSINMIVAIAAPFAAVAFYFAKTAPAAAVLAKKTAWRVVGSLSGSWLVFFLLFLFLMKKKYRRTFFSWETGFEWAQNFFLKGETDDVKSAVLGCNRKQWKAIEGDVKAWVLDGWDEWEETTPGFFTDVFKSSLDDDWLSAAELRKQKVAGGGQRRRSSLGELMGGSVRERRGSATVVPFNNGVDTHVRDGDEGFTEPTVVTLPEEGVVEAEKKKVTKKKKRCEDDSSR
jgi:hypothetical protein